MRSGSSYKDRQFFGADAKTRMLVYDFCHAKGLPHEHYQMMRQRLSRQYSDLWEVMKLFEVIRSHDSQYHATDALILLLKGLSSSVSPLRQMIPISMISVIKSLRFMTADNLELLKNNCPAIFQLYMGLMQRFGVLAVGVHSHSPSTWIFVINSY